jgi:hypothetical protein
MLALPLAAGEHPVATICGPTLQPARNGLPSLVSDFELDWAPGLLLEHDGSMPYRPGRNHIANAQGHNVTASQLAVYRQIKQCQVANPSLNLEANPDAPNMHWP